MGELSMRFEEGGKVRGSKLREEEFVWILLTLGVDSEGRVLILLMSSYSYFQKSWYLR